MDQQTVLQQVVSWARVDENIRAVVLTGSVARGTFDDLSDLDIELYVTNPQVLLETPTWYEQFGTVLVVEALENPGWHPTRLVYYADGKIDFMIAPATVLPRRAPRVHPFQVLLDKDRAAAALPQSPPEVGRPTTREFHECVHWFYAAAIMWAVHLARNAPWPGKVRDWDSKQQLRRMLEWDRQVALLDHNAACWSGLSRDDSIRALRESLGVFEAASARTAAALGIEPFDATRVRERIESLLASHRSVTELPRNRP